MILVVVASEVVFWEVLFQGVVRKDLFVQVLLLVGLLESGFLFLDTQCIL